MWFNTITRVGRHYRHFRRYREIAGVLLKHGFGDLLHRIGLHPSFGRSLFRRRSETAPAIAAEILSRHERVRLAFEELGATFVKFGQVLSTRSDLLPTAMLTELEKLQDAVPPFPGAQAKAVVAMEFHKPLCDLFTDFDETPVAAASIAQVHRATLFDGAQVAVKIRRPGIERSVEIDLGIMEDLAGLVERMIPEALTIEPVRLVQEFAQNLRRELDLCSEAQYIERFRVLYGEDSRIHVPAIYPELSTTRVLTMEYIDGIKISRIEELTQRGYDCAKLATTGAKLTMEQVFIHGFFHGDPHPGNITVLPDGVLCYFDYGLMGVLTLRQRDLLGDLFLGLATRDERRLALAVMRFSGQHRVDQLPRLEADLLNFLETYANRPLRDIQIGLVLAETARVMLKHGIRLPPEFFLLSKAMAMIEGTGRKLDPAFDVMTAVEPFARRLIKERFSPRRFMKRVMASVGEMHAFLEELPAEITDLLGQARRGELRIKFEHRGMEKLSLAFDQTSNRIAFAIVLAALIVGSAVIIHSHTPPLWHDISVIGLLGFSLSGIMGFSLLWSILKHGKM